MERREGRQTERQLRLGSIEALGSQHREQSIVVGGRTLQLTPVYDTYWRFAAERQRVYLSRVFGDEHPWTPDPILSQYRFTNVFRVSDRVTQYLLSKVIYAPESKQDPANLIFRILLFKIFNKISTWELLEANVGEITWDGYDHERVAEVLDAASNDGPIYSAAYVMPPPKLNEKSKHRNHLRLIESMMSEGLPSRILEADSLREIYEVLRSFPSIGPFLAYQYSIDLNYSALTDFDEDDFVVAGPGARDGIRKCFGPNAAGLEETLVAYMTEIQDEEFERLGVRFPGLFGRRLHLIDCQNLFCEVDKYARVAHPEVPGSSGRRRIKQSFSAQGAVPPPTFPPKWGLEATA